MRVFEREEYVDWRQGVPSPVDKRDQLEHPRVGKQQENRPQLEHPRVGKRRESSSH